MSTVQGLPYCRKARELLMGLNRAEWLDSYNDDVRRQTIEETNALYRRNKDLIAVMKKSAEEDDDPATAGTASSPYFGCTCFVYHNCILRNKRCLLAYHYARMNAIQELRWKTGSIVPLDLKPKLCESELKFFDEYDHIVSEYMEDMEIDLTADMVPPKQLLIKVRVLEDCGEIATDTGALVLQKGTTHFVRRRDVEHLIRQDKLMQIG